MNRRDFFRSTATAGLGAGLLSPFSPGTQFFDPSGEVKNIIFLVSDGMSSGTLQMADLLRKRMDGHHSNWIQLYLDNKISRGLMDMASADSSVTDSAAAASSWGGGVRVNNRSLNVGPEGQVYTPIFQKFKSAGKSVGCVTTVPITHATPAGFLISTKSRADQEAIAGLYLQHNFDVLLGGGYEYFDSSKRADGRDIFAEFRQKGYHIALAKDDLTQAPYGKPILGVFHEGGLPFTLDQMQSRELAQKVPSLSEMTAEAIKKLKNNRNGFVVQVEAGKVDWAAHNNDLGAILYDQLEFDKAIKVATDFADEDKETLVIITTDHGNANPGLFSGRRADDNFDQVKNFTHTADHVLRSIERDMTPKQVIELIEYNKGIAINSDEAKEILNYYYHIDETDRQSFRLPYAKFARVMTPYTNVGWAGTSHSADYVEIAMYGAGREHLPPFLLNTDLHQYMLQVTAVNG